MRQTFAILLLVVGSTGAGLGLHLQAAPQAPRAQDSDVLPALLTEVHGLRLAMEQMAAAGPRVQLALGRLQLQEQRVNTLMRRLESLQSEIVTASQQSDTFKFELTRTEQAVKSGAITPEVQRDLEGMLPQIRGNWTRAAANLQRLQLEESTLSGELAAEQERWTEINRQLEELERALTRK